jgi:hypothetical protein
LPATVRRALLRQFGLDEAQQPPAVTWFNAGR